MAFSTNEGNGWKGSDQKGNCYNCGKPGHRKDDCWEEGGGKEDQKPNWLKEKEKWRKEKKEGSGKEEDKQKTKASATTAMIDDMAWIAYLSDPTDNDGNQPILFSDDEIDLDDFLGVDEELRKETRRGQKDPQEECYSAQDTDPASTRNWVHETTSSKPEKERLDWWDELVEGERDSIDEQVDKAGNQPIPQLAKPKNEEVERTDDDLGSTTKSAQDAEDQAMALWLYDAEDDENGKEDEVNRVSVTMKNAVEDLEPPHTSSDKSRGEGGGGVSLVNPRKHPGITMNEVKGQRKVNPEVEDDAKSIPHTESMPTDPNTRVSNPPAIAEIVKTRGIPYHKTPSHTPMGTSPTTTVAAPTVTGFLEKPGATLTEAVKRDFRDLGGTRNMRLVYRKEDEDLLGWEDPGEAPQHRMEGYMPMVDGETVPLDQSKGAGTRDIEGEAEEKNAAENFARLIREDALPNRDVLPHQRSTNGARV